VLKFLGQKTPVELQDADLDTFWQWAIRHWNPAAIPRTRTILPGL
jgi:glutamyl-Q tRNA(Asp) synthetase